MELECNIYEKTLPSFEFVNYNLKPAVTTRNTETRRNEECKEEYFANDTTAFLKKDKPKEKCIKKSLSRPQLNRYNSVRNMSSKSKSKSRNNSRSISRNNSRNGSTTASKPVMKEPAKEQAKELPTHPSHPSHPSPKEGKMFFGYYFDRKLK